MTSTRAPHVARTAHAALREATSAQHVALGSTPQMKRLLADDYTLVEYRAHLERLLGYLEPLERAAAGAMTVDGAPHFLRRSAALRADLRAMGLATTDIAALARCREVPVLEPAGIRGYLYAMLGSLLGGRMIARRLRAVLGPHAALRFYSTGKRTVDVRWSGFCEELERTGSDEIDASCATANAVFGGYAAWMRGDRSAAERECTA